MGDLSMLKFQGVQGKSTTSTRWDSLVSLQGIRGESQVAGYAGWIPLLSFSRASMGGGRLPSPVIRCQALLAIHSSRLYMACANGTNIPSATIAVLRDGKKHMTMAMTDVIIASIGSQTGSGLPAAEVFDLDFSTISQSFY